MSLRGRVTLLVVVVVLPLLAGAALLQRVSTRAAAPTAAEMDAALGAARERIALLRARAADQAELLAQRNAAARVTADDAADAQEWLAEQFPSRGSADVPARVSRDAKFDDAAAARSDIVLLVRRDRTPLAVHQAAPPAGITGPTAEQIARNVSGPPPPGVALETRALWPAGQFAGWVVTGVWLDDELARGLPAPDAALIDGATVLGTSSALPPDLALPAGATNAGPRMLGRYLVSVAALDGDRRLLLWASVPHAGATALIWTVMLLWVLTGVAVAQLALDRAVVGPVRRAATVARAAAAGDLDQRVELAGPPELHDLGAALNAMTSELEQRLRELAESRDQLRGALSRLGETLSSSLNLDRTLAVVTDTAMDTVQADRATLVLTTEDDDLEVKIDRGFGFGEDTRFDDHSLPGWVVRTGLSVRLPADHVVISSAVDGGVLATHQLSVPVSGTAKGGCIGALILTRPEHGPSFNEDDLRTVRTFANQAGVAIENVLLHQEARRLSLTDPLTELWNFRYFQLQAIREVEAAIRYRRPLGLLIVDLDHFKRINDRHGHPVGDQVLAEVARRIRTSTRLPDIVARYGGEEFVLLLPGTDDSGAVVTAERIRRRVSRLPIVAGGQDALRISVTCSVGVAAYPVHGQSVDELLRRADAALYTAKSEGRDRVVNAGDIAADVQAPTSSRVGVW
ncbi:MAG TPA: diguanylate cyclase [Euzebyales bacterium]|nr:diguanylate cyclase [Euzebyales bacterium]